MRCFGGSCQLAPAHLFCSYERGQELSERGSLGCAQQHCQECVCSRSSSKNKTGQSPARPASAAERGDRGACSCNSQRGNGRELREGLRPLQGGKLRPAEDVPYPSSGPARSPEGCLILGALLLMMSWPWATYSAWPQLSHL